MPKLILVTISRSSPPTWQVVPRRGRSKSTRRIVTAHRPPARHLLVKPWAGKRGSCERRRAGTPVLAVTIPIRTNRRPIVEQAMWACRNTLQAHSQLSCPSSSPHQSSMAGSSMSHVLDRFAPGSNLILDNDPAPDPTTFKTIPTSPDGDAADRKS